ncbi:hypothetical protein GCM10023215_31580 [Pseudonocardia yuanmonensis]|uniref:Uncharacterized protein n=1 Tax=Pseudonocardia yuanmonensis TaxID=1095914 RepID=A0ABP8WM61_9PSEU
MWVYVGTNPLSGKRHRAEEYVPAGPQAAKEAEKVRTRLLDEVDERRATRTNATVDQLLDRYLDVLEVEATTRDGHERMARLYIRPLLGRSKSAGSTARSSTPSTRSSAAAAPAVHAVGVRSTTAYLANMPAATAAPRTYADPSAPPTCARCRCSSTAPSHAP